MPRELITVDVATTDLVKVEHALRQRLAPYRNARIVTLTSVPPNLWQWRAHTQILAAIEYDE
ncbi:hypothetical protein [Leifsonia shinshuensis]|uniref:Uncharacterized protein n=1 Tax=Leifsonia shinshuensis TaxID=150026 RepID=A0A7G6Y7J5_9MICO|nr:hypothetical protein [Leifsonia shinshuensis]QNE34460.1 hypothetical protein F1C12_04490 [Leifsonia shinshuensis]